MKEWKALNARIEKLAEKYEKKHGKKPVIFTIDFSDGEVQLCSKIKRDGGSRTAERPYMNAKIKMPSWVW